MSRVIVNGPYIPKKKEGDKEVSKPEEEWDDEDDIEDELKYKVINILYYAANSEEFKKLVRRNTTKKMWDKLKLTYEGESILETFNRLGKIINDLDALGKYYTKEDMIEKIVMSLTAPWKSKVTIITENLKFASLTLDRLRGNLIAYESIFLKEEMESKKKQLEVSLKIEKEDCS